MLRIILIIFSSLLTIVACRSAKNQNISTQIQQGVDGYVYKISGNMMPMPGANPVKPGGISTTVFIYELTNIKYVLRIGTSATYSSVNKKFITSVQSDSTGHFTVQLPVGSYSLFTKIGNLFYANLFDAENNITPVKVIEGKVTRVVIKFDAGATY